MSTREVFESDTEPGMFGILCEGGIEYEADFDSREEAQAIADAHDKGARTYEEAHATIYGAERCPECDGKILPSQYCMMGHWCGETA